MSFQPPEDGLGQLRDGPVSSRPKLSAPTRSASGLRFDFVFSIESAMKKVQLHILSLSPLNWVEKQGIGYAELQQKVCQIPGEMRYLFWEFCSDGRYLGTTLSSFLPLSPLILFWEARPLSPKFLLISNHLAFLGRKSRGWILYIPNHLSL